MMGRVAISCAEQRGKKGRGSGGWLGHATRRRIGGGSQRKMSGWLATGWQHR
jgi:hypothetical protein